MNSKISAIGVIAVVMIVSGLRRMWRSDRPVRMRVSLRMRLALGRDEEVVDGCLDDVQAIWEEVRLIGRLSVARSDPAIVLCGDSSFCLRQCPAMTGLPSDLQDGDLVIVPCRGKVSAHDVQPRCRADVPEVHADGALP